MLQLTAGAVTILGSLMGLLAWWLRTQVSNWRAEDKFIIQGWLTTLRNEVTQWRDNDKSIFREALEDHHKQISAWRDDDRRDLHEWLRISGAESERRLASIERRLEKALG